MSDGALLAAYLATTWTVDAPGGPVAVRPGERAPAALCPSAIVTAYNPASEPRADDENHRADADLHARIVAGGWVPWRTLARGEDDPAGVWDEPGWCIPGDVRDEGVTLGAAFGQNAIVWIDVAGAVAIVCTRDGFCGARMGEVVR